MSRLAPALAVALFLAGRPALGAENPLEPLAWLVGGTWVSELKPPKGEPLTVRMTVEWTAQRQAIRYAIVFKTKDAELTQYEGPYYWHPGAKEIRLLQIDRGGQVTEAALTVAGDKWTQKNTLTRTDGTRVEQRAELVREGPDAFRFRAFVPKGEDWVVGLDITYKRLKDAPPAKR